MSVVVPTITTDNHLDFRLQMETATGFAKRVHIDLGDGQFTPNKLIDLSEIWWPPGTITDIHLMYAFPEQLTQILLHLRPNLVILHAEAEGNFIKVAELLHAKHIQIGVALLPQTDPDVVARAQKYIDHVLLFSGDLGHFGGKADMSLLAKVAKIKAWKRQVEIGWDGGINNENAKSLAEGGIDVLNVGGYIQKAPDPAAAYDTLKAEAEHIG